MSRSISGPVRLGVIGLGPNWEDRYRRALLQSSEHFEVVLLCDQVRQRADREAGRLGCDAAEGPGDLLRCGDLDAIVLMDQQWYGLWPLEAACQLGKPVLCVASPESDLEQAGPLLDQVAGAGLPIMFALRSRYTSSAIRVRRLLQARFGPPRLIFCQRWQAPGSALEPVDLCIHLMKGSPQRVLAGSTQSPSGETYESLFLDFGRGRAAQINLARGAVKTRDRLEIAAERGFVTLQGASRVRWSQENRACLERLPRHRSPELRILRHFHRLVTGTASGVPGVHDAQLAFRVLQAAIQSRTEGRAVTLHAGKN